MQCKMRVLGLVLAVLTLFGGCAEPSRQEESSIPVIQLGGDLVCIEISRFSGRFVEDGSDEPVKDVAAILVENNTGKFVELATATYRVGDRIATFRITGLPAGERAWVLEQNRMTLTEGEKLVYEDCQITYNANAIQSTSDLAVTRQGGALIIENKSGRPLKNVCVYYKNRLEDGAFMGGIAYLINFADLEPGESASRTVSHFVDRSVIVRFSYQYADT